MFVISLCIYIYIFCFEGQADNRKLLSGNARHLAQLALVAAGVLSASFFPSWMESSTTYLFSFSIIVLLPNASFSLVRQKIPVF